jgi:hypothetical protein
MNLQVKLTAVLAVVILAKQHYLHVSFSFYKDEEVHEIALEQSVLKLIGFFGGDQPHYA